MKAAFEIEIKKGNKGLRGWYERITTNDYLHDEVVVCTGDSLEEMRAKADRYAYELAVKIDSNKYPNARIIVGRRLHWNYMYGGIQL